MIQMSNVKDNIFLGTSICNLNNRPQQYQNTSTKVLIKGKKTWLFCINRVVYVLVMHSDVKFCNPYLCNYH